MAQYEIAIIYHPSLEIDLSKGEEQIHKIFTASKGKVTNTDNWGKRKLAYTIKKQEFGIYVFYTVEFEPEEVKKVETALNITDEIIRYLIVKPDLKAIAQAEQKKAQKAAAHGTSSDDEPEDSEEE